MKDWKIFKPSYILELTERTFFYVFLCFIIFIFFVLTISSYSLVGDIQQEENFKIFYIHVPCAWLTISFYMIMVGFSIGFLLTSITFYDLLTFFFGKIGFVFSLLTLLTGSIWGGCTWGTYWAWDSRIASSLILTFFYFFYILLRQFFQKNFKNSFFMSFLILLGSLNIPILKFSVDWWNTLHQKQSISTNNLFLDISLLAPLFIILSFYFFFVSLIFIFEFRIFFLETKIDFFKKIEHARP